MIHVIKFLLIFALDTVDFVEESCKTYSENNYFFY